jgi:glucose 1-dehydrogenase/3-oxoacyl-[acyl-carrier protein] reductase
MAGKRVLVTGAGTGIGRGVGLEFAREGAAVVFHYAHSSSGADSAVAEAIRLRGKAKAIHADFTQVEPVQQLAKQAIEFLGGLDTLVNNAGITFNVPFEDVTPVQFDTLYSVNVRAQFFLTQACLPALMETGKGTVVNLSSVHAFADMTEQSVYAGTKGAIVSYTREMALELIQKGACLVSPVLP